MSPSELMFEYYDEEFKPFNKDKWFVALSFSLEDQNLQSGNKYIGFTESLKAVNSITRLRLKEAIALADLIL